MVKKIISGGVSPNAVMYETLGGSVHDAHGKLDAGDAIGGARAVGPKWFVSETGSAPLRPKSGNPVPRNWRETATPC